MNVDIEAEIERLKDENARLAGDVISLTDELKEVRHEARDRRHEAKSLAKQLAELTADRDRLKVQAEADPEDLKKQLGEMTGKLRSLTHRQAFERVAATLKVSDPTRQADLFALSGYDPEGDEIDETGLAATIQEALKSRPWFLDVEPVREVNDQPAAGAASTAPGGANGAQAVQLGGTPGPGADRGQSLSQPSSAAAKKAVGRL